MVINYVHYFEDADLANGSAERALKSDFDNIMAHIRNNAPNTQTVTNFYGDDAMSYEDCNEQSDGIDYERLEELKTRYLTGTKPLLFEYNDANASRHNEELMARYGNKETLDAYVKWLEYRIHIEEGDYEEECYDECEDTREYDEETTTGHNDEVNTELVMLYKTRYKNSSLSWKEELDEVNACLDSEELTEQYGGRATVMAYKHWLVDEDECMDGDECIDNDDARTDDDYDEYFEENPEEFDDECEDECNDEDGKCDEAVNERMLAVLKASFNTGYISYEQELKEIDLCLNVPDILHGFCNRSTLVAYKHWLEENNKPDDKINNLRDALKKYFE